MNSCDRDHIAHKAENIYSWALHRKKLLESVLYYLKAVLSNVNKNMNHPRVWFACRFHFHNSRIEFKSLHF